MLTANNNQLIQVMLLIMALMVNGTTHADQKMKMIVVTNDSIFHRDFVTELQKSLPFALQRNLEIYDIERFTLQEKSSAIAADVALIVAVGTDVTREVLNLGVDIPVLSAAIPKLSFTRLFDDYQINNSASKAKLTAIFLDQPVDRRLLLIRQILPDAKQVSVMLGPETQIDEAEIRDAFARHRMTLRLGLVNDEAALINSLDKTLEGSDVMLGVIDPLVFSRVSARNILLTAYRWRVPLIGISPAYVRAGALAAVYSTAQQIAKQTAEVINDSKVGGEIYFPEPLYPKYFNVSVNYKIAESMELKLETEEALRLYLAAQETQP